MQTICSKDLNKSRKLRIVPSQGPQLMRLAGPWPRGIAESHDSGLRFFVTVLFSENPKRFLSVFVADHEELLDVSGMVCKPGLVRFRVHGPIDETDECRKKIGLSEHGIVFSGVQEDLVLESGEAIVKSGHKIGGQPFFIRKDSRLEKALRGLDKDGFFHFLQIDFPDSEDDVVDGDWPFGDGIFHVWARSPFESDDFRWQWDF